MGNSQPRSLKIQEQVTEEAVCFLSEKISAREFERLKQRYHAGRGGALSREDAHELLEKLE